MADDAGRVRDAAVLRGLAHPLRARLLGLLRLEGPSTSARLAARVQESRGSTSYHLRQLASYGFVAEVEGEGTARERWWRAVHQSTSWEPADLAGQPGGAEANRAMQRLQVELMGRELAAWLAAEQDPAWQAAAGLSDYVLHLTPTETRAVLDEVYAVLDRWAGTHREQRPGSAIVNVFTAAAPRSDG